MKCQEVKKGRKKKKGALAVYILGEEYNERDLRNVNEEVQFGKFSRWHP